MNNKISRKINEVVLMDKEIKNIAYQIVEKIARKVKRATVKEFHRLGTNIGIGADGTPTKYVDKLAEDVALKVLKKADISLNLLSEEAGFIDNGGDYTFVLDPVDGTRNAYRGIPFYSVSLAVGKKDLSDVSFGLVKNIPTGELFLAEQGHGSFLNNSLISIPDVPSKELLLGVMLGSHMESTFLSLVQRNKVRSLGAASLEMCMVATGALDAFVVGREYLRVTDIAAATIIVKEVGGMVTTLQGTPLDIPLNLEERTGLIAAGTDTMVDLILKSTTI
jgi:fructose-1,6-bisphosphatase/inositol monophosphatase family enzyme